MNPMNPGREAGGRRYAPPVGRRSGVGTGTTSLLMIFTVLCFATLAMLSLSTATANQRIQSRALVRAGALAAARGAAAEEVAALDAGLLALRAAPTANDTYLANAAQACTARGWLPQPDALSYAWVTPVDAHSELVTVLRLEPMGADARYTVVRQVTRLAEGWIPGEDGQLWEGG